MKKYLFIVVVILFALQSCRTLNKSRVDEDFYEFQTDVKKEDGAMPEQVENTKDEVQKGAENVMPVPVNVKSRTEKARVVIGDANEDARYFIIMGSFSVQDNAEKLMKKLRSQGFYPTILQSPQGLYRVSAYHFNNERTARVEVGQIRQNYPQYQDAWLLIKQ